MTATPFSTNDNHDGDGHVCLAWAKPDVAQCFAGHKKGSLACHQCLLLRGQSGLSVQHGAPHDLGLILASNVKVPQTACTPTGCMWPACAPAAQDLSGCTSTGAVQAQGLYKRRGCTSTVDVQAQGSYKHRGCTSTGAVQAQKHAVHRRCLRATGWQYRYKSQVAGQ